MTINITLQQRLTIEACQDRSSHDATHERMKSLMLEAASEIASLTAERDAAFAAGFEAAASANYRDTVGYILQDDMHNRLTPRVVDIAYSAFMVAKAKNSEDGGPTDWFNDTKPLVMQAIAKIRIDLSTICAITPPDAFEAIAARDRKMRAEGMRMAADLFKHPEAVMVRDRILAAADKVEMG